MLHGLARLLLACLLVLTFALQQTGMARADGGCCPEDEDAAANEVGCTEPGEQDCAPACTDCLGCGGPARILLSAALFPALPEPIATTMERRTPGVAIGRDARLRLERPPRA